jgi:hypothetical protein
MPGSAASLYGHTLVHPHVLVSAIVVVVTIVVCMTLILRDPLRPPRRRRPQPGDPEPERVPVEAMDELCPEGWRARITLYGWRAPTPPEVPRSDVPLVHLEWEQLEDDGAGGLRSAGGRRLWASSVGVGLQAMVDGRSADHLLEEAERGFEGR